MNHKRIFFRGMVPVLVTIGMISPATAQLHSKKPVGGNNMAATTGTVNGYNDARYNPANGASVGALPGSNVIRPSENGRAMIRRTENQNTAIFHSGEYEGELLRYTDIRDPDNWARSITHSDGSYTVSKQDLETRSLTQFTYSANRVLLQERYITGDNLGNPSEVLIKDASGQFRYRGVLLYARNGLFMEEQIYDMNDRLLRRRIQEYGPNGEPKLRVVDYAENIPADLRLIISEEYDEDAAQRNLERFKREAKERKKAEKEAGKKKGFFQRLFGGKD